jgi:CelD/BcsL family acetyltransferase involved in cellulose biosynthesis
LTCRLLDGGLAEHTPLWDSLLAHKAGGSVFLTPQWQEVWWRHFGAPSQPRLLAVGPQEAPLGLAPLRADGDHWRFLGSTDLFDYHDFIDAAPGFHQSLTECLAAQPWKTLELESLREDSPALAVLPALFEAQGWRVELQDEDVVPGVALPATWDEFLAGLRKKDRHELRRKLRRLEAAGEHRISVSTAETLPGDLERFTSLMAESREEKRDFLVPERQAFLADALGAMQEAGYLRLLTLEVDGEAAAAVICFDFGGTRYLYNSGYRLALGQLSVGLMLKALAIKDAIEQGLGYFDFLRGDEPYKYHLGAQDVRLRRMLVTRA